MGFPSKFLLKASRFISFLLKIPGGCWNLSSMRECARDIRQFMISKIHSIWNHCQAWRNNEEKNGYVVFKWNIHGSDNRVVVNVWGVAQLLTPSSSLFFSKIMDRFPLSWIFASSWQVTGNTTNIVININCELSSSHFTSWTNTLLRVRNNALVPVPVPPYLTLCILLFDYLTLCWKVVHFVVEDVLPQEVSLHPLFM